MRKPTHRSHAAIAVFALLALLISGCNTMKGVGKDIEKAGEEIQKKADRKG